MDLRAEAQRHDGLVRRRLDELVPKLLNETQIDCWVLISREYAEDPVLATMLPAEWMSARRRTILVLTANERVAVSRYPVGDLFASAWNPETEPNQWKHLVQMLEDINPERIGIGMNHDQAHSDGLTATEYALLMEALPKHLGSRVVSAGLLGVRWLETRLPEERSTLEEATAAAHRILRRGLSTDAVTPGVTTTDDLVWWYRQQVADAELGSWFHPTVTVQRQSDDPIVEIHRGDLIHVDFGVIYRGMCTDQQEHAYVLDGGEATAPQGLRDGIERANHAQDILLNNFIRGRSGNEILATSLDHCRARGLDATIYTHSIGYHGHGAGMTIGLWDQQSGVPGVGDHVLNTDTAYSIELMVRSTVREWGDASVQFMLEQDAWFDGDSATWLDGRQEDLWLI